MLEAKRRGGGGMHPNILPPDLAELADVLGRGGEDGEEI